MTLLSVKDLGVTFGKPGRNYVEAAKGVSFDLSPGETVALVGESGSGKSVSALSILGLLPYPHAKHPSGSIVFEGKEILGQSEQFLRGIRGNDISMIFQEPMTALNPLHSLEKQISESLIIHKKLTKKQARKRVIDLLQLVGFADGADRLDAFPHQLSGGQRQRVMIAMALACEPKVLIADEPTTALDVTIQAEVLKLIKDLQKRFNMAMVLISHDLGMVSKMSDRLNVMKLGEVVESGDTATVFSKPKHKYTKHLIASEPSGNPTPVLKSAQKILSADNIKVSFGERKYFGFSDELENEVKAVDDVSLDLKTGETLGIVGESGSGKSTLSYHLLQLIQGTGEINFEGKRLDLMKVREMRHLRQDIQIIFQDPFASLNPRLSVGQIIAEGLFVHQSDMTPADIDQEVQNALKEVELDPKVRHRYPHEFSGGQRQRIAIARALILRPKLLVLDEPTSALDRSIQAEVIDLLRRLQKQHKLAYLFISHDLKVVQAMSHRVMVMQHGKIVESGTTEQIFSKPETEYTKSLMKAAFEIIPD